MQKLGAFLLLVFTWAAQGAERPTWTSVTPKSDSRYKYYVGRALEEISENEAWRLAKEHAQEAAVRENFGVETKISTSSYESSSHVALDKRVSEKFPTVRLINFEQLDNFVFKNGERTSVWILFRYPISEIELEKARLSGEGMSEPLEFNNVGEPQIAYSTVLEVTSHPPGVAVFIDSERWGVTPLRVSGVLSPGAHKVLLSHNSFQDVESIAVLVNGANKKIHHDLKRAIGYLRVTAFPMKVEILIDGVSQGLAPTSLIEIPVGPLVRVEARRDGYETQIQIIEVKKDETRNIRFALNPVQRFITEEGETTEVATPLVLPDQKSHQTAWVFGVFAGYSNPSAPAEFALPTAQVGVSLEKRFLWFFGLRAGASYDWATEDTETSQTSQTSQYSAIEGSGAFIGLPIYLTTKAYGFYVMPEIGHINHKRMKDQDASSTQYYEEEFFEMSAKRSGVRVGYMNLNSNFDFWVASHTYDWREYGSVQATSFGITFTLSDGER